MSLVFYDTETTGKRKFFDQILQFSAVRTSDELDVEDDHIDLRCRLLPYIVPSPGALQVNRISVAQLSNPLLPSHYEMVRSIRRKLVAWSPTVFIGYNSIDFDEHFLRQALYQTLHDPYLTSGGNNCRADALRLARAVHTYCPGILEVPHYEDGRPNLQLKALAPANGYFDHKAHDALFDVHASIFICKIIQNQAPNFWSHFIRFTKKAAVEYFVQDEPIFCLSDFFQGTTRTAVVTSIGALSTSRKNDLVVFDLNVDPDDVAAMSDEQLLLLCSYPQSTVRTFRTNACPIIFGRDDLPDYIDRALVSDSDARQRSAQLMGNEPLKARLRSALERAQKPFPPARYVEQELYGGRMLTNEDRDQLETFHDTPWERRTSLLNQFRDRRFQQLGRRLLFVERPDLLAIEVQQKMNLMITQRLVESDGQDTWLCLKEAIREIEQMLGSGSAHNDPFLLEHYEALKARLDQLSTPLQ